MKVKGNHINKLSRCNQYIKCHKWDDAFSDKTIKHCSEKKFSKPDISNNSHLTE